jgi:predicted PurR-regulated permease PerM
MSERKVVGRNVAIVLGIICIILVVGLIVAVANYTSIIKGKDDTIASLQNQVGDLNSIINLEKWNAKRIR